MAKWSSQHNGKYPDPYSKIKLDEEKKVKKKKKKKDKDKNRDSILSSLDPNTNTKVNSFPIMLGGIHKPFTYVGSFVLWAISSKKDALRLVYSKTHTYRLQFFSPMLYNHYGQSSR